MCKFMFLVLAALSIAACSTSPIAPSQATPIKPLLYAEHTATNTAELTIVRDSGLLGFDCEIEIYVDSEKVGIFEGRSETFTVWLSPQQHTITAVSPGHGLCGHGEAALNWNPQNRLHVYRTGFVSNGTVTLTPEVY